MLRQSPAPSRRCPFPECASHRLPDPKGIVRHGYMKSRAGARIRLLCRTCGRTFCSRRGTAYYRLQHPRRTFDEFATLLAEGLSLAALARALDVSPATISRWLDRASEHALAFSDEHGHVEEATELQFDELSARPAAEASSPWVFTGIEVGTRFWVSAHVGKRSRRSTRAFTLRARLACVPSDAELLICSDPFEYYEREIQRAFPPTCVYVQVKNVYRRDWIVRSRATVVLGTPERAEDLLERSADSRRMNTSFVERLNLFLRRSCSYLHRRTSGRVRNPARLASAVEIVRCSYNFLRPHGALRIGDVTRTPAMQAGAFSRRLRWRDVFAWPRIPQFASDQRLRATSSSPAPVRS